MAKVSVIMSVFNSGTLLKEAVQSIQNQSFKDFEFLIVNDGSTDETRESLKCFSEDDDRIQIFDNKKNKGLAASLNMAWKQASGDFIARMDADDISEPERLEKQYVFLKKKQDVCVLGTNASLINRKNETIGKSIRRESHESLVRHMPTENPFFHSSVMMRKEFLLATGGYDEKFRRSQDYDLWSRGTSIGKYHNLQDCLLRYRVAEKISWSTIYWGSYSKFCHAQRHGNTCLGYWYASRFIVGCLVAKLKFLS